MATCRQCGSTEDVAAKFCVRCGAQMPEDAGRWWEAGASGDAPAAPAPGSAFDRPTMQPSSGPGTSFPSGPSAPPAFGAPQWQAPGGAFGEPTMVSSAPSPAGRSKRTRRIAFGAVGALLVVGVAGVAYRTLSGSSAGAGSPQSAVGDFMAAIADENPLDLVNTLSPSELRSMSAVVDEVTDASQNKGEAAEQAKLNGINIDPDDLVPGFDLTIDSLTYVTDELAPGRVAKVTVQDLSGSWTFDPAELLEAVDVDKLTDGQVSNEELLDDLETQTGSFDERDLTLQVYDDERDDYVDVEPFLMTLHEDDGWFVSPTYTVLEYIRVLNGIEAEPDFSEPASNGAADPAAAIERTIEAYAEAATTRDIGTFIDTLPPSRYGALYAYREPLRDLLGGGRADSDTTVRATVTLDETTTFDDARGEGVTIERGRIEVEVEVRYDDGYTSLDSVTFDIDGACVTAAVGSADVDSDEAGVEDEGDSEQFCLDRLGSSGYSGPFADGIPGIDKFWLVLQQESGGWYVDPLATFGSWFEAVDDTAFTDEIQRYVDDQQGRFDIDG